MNFGPLIGGTPAHPVNFFSEQRFPVTRIKIDFPRNFEGDMSKDLYIEISAHFGIESVENLIADRRNRFINRYGETDDFLGLCQMLR